MYFKALACCAAPLYLSLGKPFPRAPEMLLQREGTCQLLAVNLMPLKIHIDEAQIDGLRALPSADPHPGNIGGGGGGTPFS